MRNQAHGVGRLLFCGTVAIWFAWGVISASATAQDASPSAPKADFRVWRSADRSVSQEAKLDSVREGFAHVLLRDGTRGRIAVSALSAEDQAYLSSFEQAGRLFEPVGSALSEPVDRPGRASSPSRVANKPVIEREPGLESGGVPPEYRVVAKALGLPIHLDPSEFIEKDITALRAELEENIAKLRQIQSSDSEIARLAEVAATSYAQAGDCLDRIEQLPKPPSDIELLGSSLLAGFATGDPIMGALAGASVGADSDSKKQAIIREMEQLARIHQKADVAHLGLARVARKYAGAPVDGAARISVDLNEAWGSFGPFDWLCLYNHGAAAKDCTIEVELTGADGSARKNVHFVAEWPADQWLYARYEPGFVLRDTRVLSQSVASVKSVTVRIISPEFSTVREYVYQGAEKDKDIAERLKSVSLDLKYQRFVKGLLWDTERGCYVAVRGGGFMECRVDVNFMKGGRRLNGWFWQFDSWQDGEEKSFLTNAGDLTSDPDEIVVTISFPGTVEKIQRTFRVF